MRGRGYVLFLQSVLSAAPARALVGLRAWGNPGFLVGYKGPQPARSGCRPSSRAVGPTERPSDAQCRAGRPAWTCRARRRGDHPRSTGGIAIHPGGRRSRSAALSGRRRCSTRSPSVHTFSPSPRPRRSDRAVSRERIHCVPVHSRSGASTGDDKLTCQTGRPPARSSHLFTDRIVAQLGPRCMKRGCWASAARRQAWSSASRWRALSGVTRSSPAAAPCRARPASAPRPRGRASPP